MAGKLQLAPGTTVLLDEAQMAQGTLNEALRSGFGVDAVRRVGSGGMG